MLILINWRSCNHCFKNEWTLEFTNFSFSRCWPSSSGCFICFGTLDSKTWASYIVKRNGYSSPSRLSFVHNFPLSFGGCHQIKVRQAQPTTQSYTDFKVRERNLTYLIENYWQNWFVYLFGKRSIWSLAYKTNELIYSN